MAMTAFIFGSNGQDGYYLNVLLKRLGLRTILSSRSSGDIMGDVGDLVFVEKQIANFLPDYIFHLAAISTTDHRAAFENHSAITTGTLNILESVRKYVPSARVFISGSAMQFQNNGPINETTPFEPSSSYSVSRICSVYTARYYRLKFNLKVYVGYFFNHDSPLRSDQHINQKIATYVQRVKTGTNEKLIIGDVSVRKEFNYAGDVVEAVWLLLNQDRVSEAVIGSGVTHSIAEWLEYCFRKIDRNWQDHIEINQSYRSEYKELRSDPSVIKSLGWRPKLDYRDLADLMMESNEK